MRINYNLSAMITNSQLFRNEKGQQSAAERLASGLKINHAKDDPAGMAISNKMDVQIEGIRQASRNSSDGISVLESADSSLNEVTNIIQRMRELAVQAASDTNQIEDRQAIQVEIDSLSVEIDRISKNTEFNKKVLLDGSLSRRSYTDNKKVTVTDIGQGVPTDKYGITVTADARQAVFKAGTIFESGPIATGAKKVREQELKDAFDLLNVNDPKEGGKLKAEAAGRVTINGHIIKLEAGDTYEEIYRKLRDGAEIVDVNCIAASNHNSTGAAYLFFGSSDCPDPSGKNESTAGYIPNPEGWKGLDQLIFISKEYGSAEKLNISCDNALLASGLGLAAKAGDPLTDSMFKKATASGTSATSAEIKCYRSTDTFLREMPTPPVILDRNNPAHNKYFDDPAIRQEIEDKNMIMPAITIDGLKDVNVEENKKYLTFYDKVDALPKELEGHIKIDAGAYNKTVNITENMRADQVFAALKEACGNSVDLYLTDDVRSDKYTILDQPYNYSQALVFRDKATGEGLTVSCDNPRLSLMLGLPVCEWSVSGKDCRAEFTDGDDTTDGTQRIGFADSATITTKGNKIIVTDKNGFEIDMEAEVKTCGTYYADYSASGRIGCDITMQHGDEAGTITGAEGLYTNFPKGSKADIIADVTGYGMMTVHVGANENQIIDMDIPEVSTKSLGIENLNVRSGWTADKALEKLDAALIEVSKVRSRLGAYQNRLESTVNSLNANDEDLTASVSRIRDVDMAQETTEYTQYTILVQAATSVLAQANELPQQALQLIQ